jgi:hypothetical protein
MKKSNKYLELYKKWDLSGKIDHYDGWSPNGLCHSSVANSAFFKLFRPDNVEFETLAGNNGYWASDITGAEYAASHRSRKDVVGEVFSPTRQNIVLLVAFMEGETL